MAQNTLGLNKKFPIRNADGTAFNDLVLHKATYNSVVMSLGDKITGDVYFRDNSLAVTMSEYIAYDGVKFVLVNPPTIVREGMVSDNSGLNGMTKYSFEFYHPMYMLANFPFTDVAVSNDEKRYKSQDKTFSWVGTGNDLIAKLNKNLQGTQWLVDKSDDPQAVANLAKLPSEIPSSTTGETAQSNVLSFDNSTIADVIKKVYDVWCVPFVISSITSGTDYDSGKRFRVTFGLPSNEILDDEGHPFVFQFGQGVGLKNNSRTPRNNKIITRIAAYGSEDNIPYGYPQILWTGNQDWDYTINNDSTAANSYPIYKGIVGGQWVKLIKHPFTRTHLMPSVFTDRVNKKVNPYTTGYDPDIEIIDYYDADNSYPNPIVADAPSYEIHQFDYIKPELGSAEIVGVEAWDGKADEEPYITWAQFVANIETFAVASNNYKEKTILRNVPWTVQTYADTTEKVTSDKAGSYIVSYYYHKDDDYYYVKYASDTAAFEYRILIQGHPAPSVNWDDTMDDDGNYVQSYFKITLPQLSFDLYASAAITQEMKINMRSGACIGCTFPVEIDWEDYKTNFYDANGNFAPDGSQRDLTKYPKSNLGQITVIVKKDLDTFGTLMPNIYQQPHAGDKFVILGISLPTSYITTAEETLDETMKQYMLENNVYYYDYPLKFDEHFLATHTDILSQIKNNTIVRFVFGGMTNVLYVKQMTVKYGESPLPKYDITLTDDVEIVLNQIGQVTDDVSRMRVQVNELQKYYSENLIEAIDSKLSRVADDIAQGRITFQQGLVTLAKTVFGDEIGSPDFKTGMYDGTGWRIDSLGNAEFESARIRSFLEVVELLINRLQAQEGDTLFSDNDQVDYVQRVVDETDGSVSYILSLKEKWSGYITSQMYGNILKGIINTLAAKAGGVSDESGTSVEVDGSNKYYTSWMRVIATHNTDNTLGLNQIRVVLFGDNEVPAGRNFAPCELMTFARWGCIDYSAADTSEYTAEGLETESAVKASIRKRQTVFYISTNEGRIVKLTGVNKPILEEGNYGMVFGNIPDFIRQWDSWDRLVKEHPHLEDRDYLYAQGLIYEDLVHVDITGAPVPVTVYCGDWVDGSTVATPTIGNGIYFNIGWNDTNKQFERHTVRHNNGTWMCLQNQPVVLEGVATYYEPKWNSPYWRLIDGNGNYSIEFVSTMGSSFYVGYVNTVLTPHLYYGNVDISADVAEQYWSWTRSTESGSTAADTIWNNAHKQTRVLNLTNEDMPTAWARNNKAIFTCTVVVNDGNSQVIIQNQVIA